MAKLHLIGTWHLDLDGKRRLEKALIEEEPEIVTLESVENHPFYLAYLREKAEDLIKEMQKRGYSESKIEDSRKILSVVGFEYESCKNYCEERGIPLHFVEEEETYNSQFFSDIKKTVQLEKTPKRNPIKRSRKATNSWYGLCQAIFESKLSGKGVNKLFSNRTVSYKILGKRDLFMAERIQELASRHEGKIVHVGGLMHLLENDVTLYSRLQEYDPSRKALGAYDESFKGMGPISLMRWKVLDAFINKIIR